MSTLVLMLPSKLFEQISARLVPKVALSSKISVNRRITEKSSVKQVLSSSVMNPPPKRVQASLKISLCFSSARRSSVRDWLVVSFMF